jgi:hypothetical protein
MREGKTMRHARSVRLLAFMLVLMLGLVSLPAAPVAAQNCANTGPGAFLAGCDLSGLDLSGANLSGANLRGANLEGADLDGTNLSGANLSNATVTEGALDTATTSGANLRGIRWVPAAHPIPTLVYSYDGVIGAITYCGVQAHVDGFGPNLTYDVQFFNNGVHLDEFDRSLTTDASGEGTTLAFSIRSDSGSFEVSVGGVRSGAIPMPLDCM